MESLLHFLGVALVVELQESLKDFTAGGFADGEANALLGLGENVAEIEIVPAVGSGDSLVHLDVEVTERLDFGADSSGSWNRL